MNRLNGDPRRRPEAMARRRPDEGHLVIQQIVRGLVESRRPGPAGDHAALRAEMTTALREALTGQSPAPPIREGWGSAADMIRLALERGGFDLTDLYAVEGWYATGVAALEAELAGVEPVATGVGDDPYLRSPAAACRRYRLRLAKLTPANVDRVLAEIFRICPPLGPPTCAGPADVLLAPADIGAAVVAVLQEAGTGAVGTAVMSLDGYDVGELVRLLPAAACGRLAAAAVKLVLQPDDRGVESPGSGDHLYNTCANAWHRTRLILTDPEVDRPLEPEVAAVLRRGIAAKLRREFAGLGLRPARVRTCLEEVLACVDDAIARFAAPER